MVYLINFNDLPGLVCFKILTYIILFIEINDLDPGMGSILAYFVISPIFFGKRGLLISINSYYREIQK